MRGVRRGLLAGGALVAVVLAVAGCSGSRVHTIVTTQTVQSTTTETLTSPPPSSYTPKPAATVAPLGEANAPMPAGETEGPCPYIDTQTVADTEGNRIYRSSVITSTTPPGCRFYFWASPFQATADIVPTTFATTTDAYNAMVATGEAGASPEAVKNLIPGVDAVLYQTQFFGPDGPTDWACTFATGKVMVTVHTEETNVSYNARQLATLLAPKF